MTEQPTQFRRLARARKHGDTDWMLYDTGLVTEPDRTRTVDLLDPEAAIAFCQEHGFTGLERIYYVPLDPQHQPNAEAWA